LQSVLARRITVDRASLTDLIVTEAREWIGTPYHHQMAVKGVGCDCLGLVRGVFKKVYGWEPEVPPYSPDWGDANNSETLMEAGFQYLEPITLEEYAAGDVVGIRWKEHRVVKHVLIMTSRDTAVHAHNRVNCKEIRLNHYRPLVSVAFRFPLKGE